MFVPDKLKAYEEALQADDSLCSSTCPLMTQS